MTFDLRNEKKKTLENNINLENINKTNVCKEKNK